jgi:hypothetical protein
VDLDSLIISAFCLVDDMLRRAVPTRLRRRGPRPLLADSEVLCIEVIGEHLGLSRDTELFGYFRRHYAHFFPALARVHRTTFVRQAANLWKVKEALWQRLLERTGCDPSWAMADSFPLAVCRFGRAPRCRRFRGLAAYGRDHAAKATIYGFRLHARVAWPGVVTRLSLAPAGVPDVAVSEELTDRARGLCLADRAYWKPESHGWLRERGVEMLVLFHKASHDPTPERSRRITSIRYRIETVFSQLCERLSMKRVWARDLWHLSSRLLRKVLAHTTMVALNREQGHEPLRLAELLTD